jgi:hypothetical protein
MTGGEPDAPMKYENKQYELWEHMRYVTCEVLGWRGIWLSEERRRMGNVDVGRAEYLGLPYYGRWLLAVARILVEKHHIGLTELSERMAEVKERYAGGLAGKTVEAKPKSEGDGSQVKRNEHHKHALGKGDPHVYTGQAGPPKFKVGDAVVVSFQSFSTPAPRNTCAARKVKSKLSHTKAPPPRTRHGIVPPHRSGFTSFGSTCPSSGTAIPERPMTSSQPKFPNAGCKPPNKLPGKEFA